MLHHLVTAIVLASLLVVPVRGALASESEPYRLRWQAGLGAAAGNNVLPLPFGLAVSTVLERHYYGFETGIQMNGATICDNPQTGSDGSCGWLLVAEAGPRLSLPLTERFGTYVSTRAQWLRMTRASSNEFGAALRVGISYQRERYGAFLEAGPTVLFGARADGVTMRSSSYSAANPSFRDRFVPMANVGMRF